MAQPSAPGRPLKFGRPARAIAVTLPHDVIAALRAMDPDVGRAIVSLVERRSSKAATTPTRAAVGLARTSRTQALIVVDPTVLPTLPGCRLMRIDRTRAFITLDPGAGSAELELAVMDRLAEPHVGDAERSALQTLRRELTRWRKDARIHTRSRAIVVLDGEGS